MSEQEKQDTTQKRYKRVLVKLSGEALQGTAGYGIDPGVLDSLATETSRASWKERYGVAVYQSHTVKVSRPDYE